MTGTPLKAVEGQLVAELRRTLGWLEEALDSIGDGLVITDAEARVLWCNAGFVTFCGRSKLLMLGEPLFSQLPRSCSGQPLLDATALQGKVGEGQSGRLTGLLSQDPLRAVEIQWREVKREASGPVVFTIRDISLLLSNAELQRRADLANERRAESETRNAQLREQQRSLAAQVVECPVTGLPNRRALQNRIAEALADLEAQAGQVTILFCDLNGFKEINDLYGHHVGDELLVEVGQRLQQGLRSGDTLARLGGDEFVVLTCGRLDEIEALELGMRLQQRLATPWIAEDYLIRPSMSVGIAGTTDPEIGIDELLRRADLAMYDAKAKNDPKISHYNDSIDLEVKRTIVLKRQLKQAIEDNELELVYQPIVTLTDAQTVGQESLVRIQSPGRPALNPSEFIPLAERTGLILPLGRWVVREAMDHVKRLQCLSRSLRTSINVSPLQLKQEGFASWFLAQAEERDLDPVLFSVEVTEGMLIDHPEQTTRELQHLRQAGVRVYLDDFGTGYSSMSWLAKLPIDAIKIDRSFAADFLMDRRKQTVLQSMITLAQDLNFTVIAEGIETEKQHIGLLEMGCTHGQGYYYGRPRGYSAD
jgi:diguanylate cyclase (GGDEF)-like protein